MAVDPNDSPLYQFATAVMEKLQTLSWMQGYTVEMTDFDTKVNMSDDKYPYIEVEIPKFNTDLWTEQLALDGRVACIVTCFVKQKKEATEEGENVKNTNWKTICNYDYEAWQKILTLMDDREEGILVCDGFTMISGQSFHMIEPIFGSKLMMFSFAVEAKVTNLSAQ